MQNVTPIGITRRPHGRSLVDFCDDNRNTLHGLMPAEEKLLVASARGEICEISDTRPVAANDDNTVRGAFLRFLLLGGDADAPVHEMGVELHGAFVDGDIDIKSAAGANPLSLSKCHIRGHFLGANARFGRLKLEATHIDGILCDYSRITGGVFLDGGFVSNGEVRFRGAKIDGYFVCDDGTFNSTDGPALNCDRSTITGSVFVSKGFVAESEVRFVGAEIGGNLNCYGGRFSNRKAGARTTAEEPITAANALHLGGAKIRDTLWLGPALMPNNMQIAVTGSINLMGAHAEIFVDHPDSWPVDKIMTSRNEYVPCVIKLNGFTYGSFGGIAPTNASIRREWLLRQSAYHLGDSFRPQPFEQLVKVLRVMGHEEDARQIAMFKQELLLPLRVNRAAWWRRPFVWLVGRLWGFLCGYGYRPHRLVVALSAVWLGCAGIYQVASGNGAFVPSDAQIWMDSNITKRCGVNWTVCEETQESLPFNPLVYSADVLIPVIDLKQRSIWMPAYAWVRGISWVENILGSLGVVLLGAILSGLVKRD